MSLLKTLNRLGDGGHVSAGHGGRIFFVVNATVLKQTVNFSVFKHGKADYARRKKRNVCF